MIQTSKHTLSNIFCPQASDATCTNVTKRDMSICELVYKEQFSNLSRKQCTI